MLEIAVFEKGLPAATHKAKTWSKVNEILSKYLVKNIDKVEIYRVEIDRSNTGEPKTPNTGE